MIDLAGLPGATLVRCGLEDLAERRPSVEALTVAIASERLRRLGIELEPAELPRDRELALYAALLARHETAAEAYARYNSLCRELDSFLEALEARRRRAQREAGARVGSA